MERAASGRRQRQYSAAEKAAAVRDSATLGFQGAGRHHGIPESTIRSWAKRAEAEGAARPVEAKERNPTDSEHSIAEGAAAASSRSVNRVARHYTPSRKAEIVEYAPAHGVTAAAKQFGASRFSVYHWGARSSEPPRARVLRPRVVPIRKPWRPSATVRS